MGNEGNGRIVAQADDFVAEALASGSLEDHDVAVFRGMMERLPGFLDLVAMWWRARADTGRAMRLFRLVLETFQDQKTLWDETRARGDVH